MNLADLISHNFDPAERALGEQIVDRVEFLELSERVLVAHVPGSRIYTVDVDWDGQGVSLHCECAVFDRRGTCEHVWAAIRARDLVWEVMAPGGSLAGTGLATAAERPRPRQVPKPAEFMDGERRLQMLLWKRRSAPQAEVQHELAPAGRIHFYLLRPQKPGDACGLIVGQSKPLKKGGWGAPTRMRGRRHRDEFLEASKVDPLVRAVWEGMLIDREYHIERADVSRLRGPEALELLAEMARQERLFSLPSAEFRSLRKDQREPVSDATADCVSLSCVIEAERGGLALRLRAELDGEILDAELLHGPYGGKGLIHAGRLLRWETATHEDLVGDLLARGSLQVGAEQEGELRALCQTPEEIGVAPPPICQLHLRDALDTPRHSSRVSGRVLFRYEVGDELFEVPLDEPSPELLTRDGLRRRDVDAEQEQLVRLQDQGARIDRDGLRPAFSLSAKEAVAGIRRLMDAGFEVYAAQDRVRRIGAPSLSVRSGQDWFEVEAHVATSDGQSLDLPDLLPAMVRREEVIRLGLGEVALLDDPSLQSVADLAMLGRRNKGALRFSKSQGFLLDALLQARGHDAVEVDAEFAELRDRCKQAGTIQARREPKGFGTELRPYQREGLGWFRFLAELGVGGCLADDMGLGKTVQVLALLEQQRRRRPRPPASLVVAPRSLVHNWEREAQRFTPKLRCLAFVGTGRFEQHAAAVESSFADYDLVLTTYGTLRNDIAELSEIAWNYVVLDEAQAIKNERSQASKAVRLCRAQHRLALSGTPIENHLGELWSLFEFLNPGMLGASEAFRKLVSGAVQVQGDGFGADFTRQLRTAVRPFLLRRTKAQVLDDLPDKSEQVLRCEMPARQRKSYDDLAAHYRANLLGELSGSGKVPQEMRFKVLEALLRLRQAACHPALIDHKRRNEVAAKTEMLLPMLEELRGEGHKALVFSQFPSFLELLKPALDAAGHRYAYLDGKTRKRAEQVDRFQGDPDCGLFLISLKAGGHGLNLTAASYVFILDPWWNPAVEAQAVDRAHRIGQEQHVHAYRLICEGTVEERVLDLQARKRELADLVLGDDPSLLQGLTGEDVAALLG